MAFCPKCGAQVDDGVKFCPSCGQPLGENKGEANSFQNTVKGLNDTADYTAQVDPADASNNKVYGILAYLGILVLITIFAAPKNSKFSKFHANQGLVLAIIDVAYSIIYGIIASLVRVEYKVLGVPTGVFHTPGWLLFVLWIPYICLGVLSIIGIINAAKGKCKDLPIIGKIRILK